MENIIISNPSKLNEKISKIKKEGKNKLHIVSDFDRTLTKGFVEGKKAMSTIALLRHGNYLTPDYPKKAFALFEEYHPIEIDTNIDIKYKCEKMTEWWSKHKQLLIDSKLNEKDVADVVLSYPKILREGVSDFLNNLYRHQIPLLIFSSGFGNFIEKYLIQENKLTPNIHIISNIFEFDKNGFITNYKDKIIHVFNKSEVSITNKKYLNSISKRKNVILLGDSLGDAAMADGTDHEVIIKIGFLNEKVEESLNKYKENFDVIILNDGPMDYVNNLLQEIIE